MNLPPISKFIFIHLGAREPKIYIHRDKLTNTLNSTSIKILVGHINMREFGCVRENRKIRSDEDLNMNTQEKKVKQYLSFENDAWLKC